MSRFQFLRKSPAVRETDPKPRMTLRQAAAPLVGRWQDEGGGQKFAVVRGKGSGFFLDVGFRSKLGNRTVKTTLRLHLKGGELFAGKERIPIVYSLPEQVMSVRDFGRFIKIKNNDQNET